MSSFQLKYTTIYYYLTFQLVNTNTKISTLDINYCIYRYNNFNNRNGVIKSSNTKGLTR